LPRRRRSSESMRRRARLDGERAPHSASTSPSPRSSGEDERLRWAKGSGTGEVASQEDDEADEDEMDEVGERCDAEEEDEGERPGVEGVEGRLAGRDAPRLSARDGKDGERDEVRRGRSSHPSADEKPRPSPSPSATDDDEAAECDHAAPAAGASSLIVHASIRPSPYALLPSSSRLTLRPSHLRSSPSSAAYALRVNAARSFIAGERRIGLLRRVDVALEDEDDVGVTGGRGRTSKMGAGGRSGAGGGGAADEGANAHGALVVSDKLRDETYGWVRGGGGEREKAGLTGEGGRRRLRGLLERAGGALLSSEKLVRRVGVTGAKGAELANDVDMAVAVRAKVARRRGGEGWQRSVSIRLAFSSSSRRLFVVTHLERGDRSTKARRDLETKKVRRATRRKRE